jgi:hypothetical protein
MATNNRVVVNISEIPKVLKAESLRTPLILSTNKGFTGLVKKYGSLSSVAEDFRTDSEEYKAASAMFSQELGELYIGRRAVNEESVITVDTAVNSTVYDVTVDGVKNSYTSSSSATIADIATGLASAIGNGASASGATVTLSASTIKVGDRLSVAHTETNSDITVDLNAIKASSNNFYGLVVLDRTVADVLNVAAWAEANEKVYFTSTGVVDVADESKNDDADSIAKQLGDLGYKKTFVFFDLHASEQWIEAAIMGKFFSYQVGSYNPDLKSLVGVKASDISDSQRSNLEEKNVGVYNVEGNYSRTHNVKSVFGNWFDQVQNQDWIVVRISESVNSLMDRVKKIPYTNIGLVQVKSAIDSVLANAVSLGIASDNPAYSITLPSLSDVTDSDKANRILNGVKFSLTLQGAINKIVIEGETKV